MYLPHLAENKYSNHAEISRPVSSTEQTLNEYSLLMTLQPILTEISMQMTWIVSLIYNIYDSLRTHTRIGKGNRDGTRTQGKKPFITNLMTSWGQVVSWTVMSKSLRTTTNIYGTETVPQITKGKLPFSLLFVSCRLL